MGIKHSFTKPYRPQNNGKAERVIQTWLRVGRWPRLGPAAKRATVACVPELCSARRPHSVLGYRPPAFRLAA
ncbi:integrase core domain-containing protein [Variovorax sp. GB1R11]|uniref:integrase core domain-containing protein n=1 Tax=Variovorax sp. GB1R11 TaxID=3443741 RepID=UPI003F45340D